MFLQKPNHFFKKISCILLFVCISPAAFSFWPFDKSAHVSYQLLTDPQIKQPLRQKINSFLKGEVSKIQRNSRLYLEKKGAEITKKLTVHLKMRGYLTPQITYKVTRKKPYRLMFLADPGPLYHWGDFHIEGLPTDLPAYRTFFIEKGKIFHGERLLKTQQLLLDHLQNNGYPKPKVANTHIVTTENSTVNVRLVFDPGLKATFGKTIIKGNQRAKTNWILKQLKYQEGQLFSEKKIEKTEKNIIKTETFDYAHGEKEINETKKTVITTLLVDEAKPRFIGGSGNISSQNGFGLKAFWGHRNLFGNGESVKLEGKMGQIDKSINALFKVPDFITPHEHLFIKSLAEREDTSAYSLKNFAQSFTFERTINRTYTLLYGASASLERNNSYFDNNRFILASLPITLKRNSTNSSFDPYEGSVQTVFIEPHTGRIEKVRLSKKGLHFLKATLETEHFMSLYDADHLVGAMRLKAGYIWGANLYSIPQSRRFYSGGGTSVRGYGFQKISPYRLADNSTKVVFTGGRTLFESSFEARYKLNESMGIVPFVDIGYISNRKKDTHQSGLLVGAGIGGRYYIDKVGPIRADLALPLQKRHVMINKGTYFKKKSLDAPLQFYVNIGHTF